MPTTKKITETNKPHSWTILKLYLFFATLAGLFGTLIGYGVLIYGVLSYQIISDAEYIAGSRSYEIDQCSQPIYKATADPKLADQVMPTKDEIAQCKKDKTESLKMSRKLDYKNNLLNGAIRGTLFLILFAMHYPRFMNMTKSKD